MNFARDTDVTYVSGGKVVFTKSSFDLVVISV